LFLTTLLFALQISARDSQFFSKVTHFDKNSVKETELPNKEAPEVNKPEQQPPFIPETENSYGLYGHHDEYNQVPSTTTNPTSYHPYKTEFENSNNKYYNNDAYNTRFSETSYNNNNNKYYNKDSYEGNQYELSDTKYTEEGYNNKYHNSYQNNYNNDAANDKYSYNNNNNNNKNYNAHNNRYNTYNNNAVSRYNGERRKNTATTDSQTLLPLYLTNALFFAVFFSVAYFLLHRWREKIRTATPLHAVSPAETAAIVSLVASAVYLLGFFGIDFVQSFISRASHDSWDLDDAVTAPSPAITKLP
ncbi:hypothetical protein P7M40_24195, partial [Vibrio parahaemolyticus]|nr:hypothetical protein [Vibrio parahaemolyticus]